MSRPPTNRRDRTTSPEWIEEKGKEGSADDSSEKASASSRRPPTTPVRRVVKSRAGSRTPIRSPVKSTASRPSRPAKSTTTLRAGSSERRQSAAESGIRLAYTVILQIIRLVHALLAPVYHYLFLIAISLLTLSIVSYALWTYIPPLLFKTPGWIIRNILPSPPDLPDIEIGRKVSIIPLRTLATPACALAGQLCSLSLLSQFDPALGKSTVSAKPFWKWRQMNNPEINMSEVARSLTKEVKGAKDIFESLQLLSNGEMMNRLEHLRIWELATAIQVGSRLEEREVVASGLRELGHTVEDLSYEMVETNALAGVAFQWLVWEFESLLKDLSAPPTTRPNPQALSKKLNNVLTRLSSNMDKLHELSSRAYTVAQRGSIQGQELHSNLNFIVADLKEAHESAPGWKLMADKANRFFVGGELSKAQRIAKDLVITNMAFTSLSASVRDLERTRLGIKEFKDQIGYFDTNLMGFHLGAGEHMGMGPEDEIRVLAQVVEDFGNSIGRVKARRGDEARGIEA